MASTIKCDTIQSTTSNVFFQNSTGTEYARFDSSGNLGIGGVPPNALTKFYVEQGIGSNVLGYFNSTATAQNARLRINSTDNASSVAYVWSYSHASLNKQASVYLTGTGALATQVGQTAGSEPTSGTTAMLIDSSGNVGIGTNSPSYKLDILTGVGGVYAAQFGNGTAAQGMRIVTGADSVGPMLTDAGGTRLVLFDRTSNNTLFYTNATERMRIDSSGNLLLNRNTQISSEKFGIEVSGSTQFAYLRSTGTSGNPTVFRIATGVFSGGIGASGNFIYCEDGGAAKFYVLGNGGIANYSASNTNLSDRREKTNFAPAGEYLSKICSIPVQTFNYIDQNLEEDGDLTLGVVAQDVQEVAPELVTESNWGTEEEPKMRLSIYQTDLQYALMKCIQEQQVLITQLQADVAALKAK